MISFSHLSSGENYIIIIIKKQTNDTSRIRLEERSGDVHELIQRAHSPSLPRCNYNDNIII